jgi:hypothetical protein
MTLSNLLQLLSVLVAFGGFVIIVYQVQQARKQIKAGEERRQEEDERRQKEVERIRRQATLEYARQTLDARHKDWKELPDDYDKDKIKDFIKRCKCEKQPGPNLEAALGYLNLLETFCIGAELKIYDDGTVFKLYGTRIIEVSEHYGSLIEWRRDKTGNDNEYKGLEDGAKRYSDMKAET